MVANNVYAQIWDETVQNTIVCENYELANQLARMCYDDTAFSVEATQYPCQIGDKYRNGTFYHVLDDGSEEVINRVPTEKEEVAILKMENTVLKDEVVNLQVALVEQYETNEALQQEVTNTQLALTELYEMGG